MRPDPFLIVSVAAFVLGAIVGGQAQAPSVAAGVALGAPVTIGESDCTAERVGATVDVSAIGERVRSVTLAAPRWTAATGNTPAYCSVDGVMAPADTAATSR